MIVFFCLDFLVKPTISDSDGVFLICLAQIENFYELLIFCFGIIELMKKPK